MEEGLHSSLQFDNSIETDDSTCLKLSTFFVAHIEELKERISELESIFCRQLFPTFQSRLKSLENKLLEERKVSDTDWQKRENSLLHQINELRLENRCAHEQVNQLRVSLEESKTSLRTNKELLRCSEHNKEQLVRNVENLEKNEEIITKLKKQLSEMSDEVAQGKQQQEKLLHEIAMKDKTAMDEKEKMKQFCEMSKKRYNDLKSQYNYVLSKISSSKEDKTHLAGMEMEKSSTSPTLTKRSIGDVKYEDEATNHHTTEMKPEDNRLKKQNASNNYMRSATTSNVNNIPSSKHPPTYGKSESLLCPKKSTLSWRDTRTRHEPGGVDPHDDFLDTPMENVRKSSKSPKEPQDLLVIAPNDMDCNISDDETQDIADITSHDDVPHKQHISIMGEVTNKGEYKYVGPVRKKAERENLKGIECNQCKKFYDAVLPDDNVGDGQKNMRCEHHQGISRHRYKYAPPLTPEGFWNIGFETEQ